MKKMYNKPIVEETPMEPKTVICASGQFGETQDPIEGD
jgi:hypothetical protein